MLKKSKRSYLILAGLISVACYILNSYLNLSNATSFLISYIALNSVLFTVYGIIIFKSLNQTLDLSESKNALYLFPILFAVVNLFVNPQFSIDVYSYLAHGSLWTNFHANPYIYPAGILPNGALKTELLQLGWTDVHGVSPYGPLWTHFEALLVSFFPKAIHAIFVEKIILSLFFLGTAFFIYKIASHFNSKSKELAVFIFLWNPMLLIETIIEGHNDIVMIFFLVAGIFYWLTQRYGLGIFAIGLSILTKYLSLLFLPLQLAFFFRQPKKTKSDCLYFSVGLFSFLILAFLLFKPLWVGRQTFNGIFWNTDRYGSSFLGVVYLITNFSDFTKIFSEILLASLAALTMFFSFRLRSDRNLILFSVLSSVFYIFIVSSVYWPWYSLLPVVLLCLIPDQRTALLILLLSITSRLVVPLDKLQALQVYSVQVQVWATFIFAVVTPVSILFFSQFIFKNRKHLFKI